MERAETAQRPADAPAPGLHRLVDYAPPPYLIDAIELTFDLDPERTLVESSLRVRRSPEAPADVPLRLDGTNLELLSLRLNGAPIEPGRFEVDSEGLTIAAPPDNFHLEITNAIEPAKNTTRQGLFELKGQLATQCEAEGFRRITYFPDRPDVLARYDVTLRADAKRYPVLLSNGDKVEEGPLEDGRRFARWIDPWPKPSYIFAVIAGDLACLADQFVTLSGRDVALGVWSEPDVSQKCRFALDSLKRALTWDEQTYGLEYDLSRYNVAALSGWSGAQENKGLNLFGAAGVIADPTIATDDDYILIERIVGHEAFHNWTGNRVTCRDWFQLCLKEGLTRFRDQHFIEDRLGAGAWRIEQVKALRRNQFPEDDGPAAHSVQPTAYAEIDNFYTNTIYEKGAEVARMLRALLGPAVFRKGFDLYIARHDGQAATVQDFIQAMEDVSGSDLSQFRVWLTQAGRPRLKASGAYDSQARTYRLSLSQSCPPTPGQPEKAPFLVPIAMGLVSRAGEAMTFTRGGSPTSQTVLELREPKAVFVFEGVASPPIPSLLRGFSAPVSLETELSDDELALLMRTDSDPFARWDASQTLAVRLIRRLAAEHAAGRPMVAPESFIEAIGHTLDDEGSDRWVRAQILSLPDEPVLSEALARVELDATMAARGFVKQEIARRLEPRLRERYAACAETGPYAPDPDGIARRKLKNAALDLLTALGTREVAELCLRQATQAPNMTDAFEALALIAHLDAPQRQEAFDRFYQRWKDHPTVVDKWFNAQALSRAPGAVDRIIALEQHPAFDPGNFSQALVYYGGFFRQNRVAFHDRSGRGYQFLADRLLSIDAQGRQGSHYLMPQINQWRRYDEPRQQLMLAALRRVAETPGISAGLAESVAKALA
ncbi:MAG TPA: aminopeptidase N [Caulobacteraceae bacterium]|nr:aminopeptidase N [Caulobacteraceae bacterium]